ncbi:hypothetical protein SBOR_9394 [Sclerotinia borealis F-4128]|uniref:Hydrophobin n=1 Tax=Sclerotinia borealis (strain F-4128) TaxID=1432307 RepID=W9C5P3_SCLBF|nr:hypothetical protein SBOR_9394 [Sclerotinia borealis F-4128]
MQFTTTTIFAVLSALVAASPLQPRRSGLCSSALDTALCCDVSVAGVANLNCAAPSTTPTTLATFQAICATGGQQASCCVLPLAGEALLCTAP